MPRSFIQTDPIFINKVFQNNSSKTHLKEDNREVLEIGTTNKFKLAEYERLLPNYKIVGVKINIEEIQSTNPIKVAEYKAKAAFEANGNNPVLIEDVSMDIKGLENLPGPFVTFFVESPNLRKEICETWLKNKDRSATVRAILSIYDGMETHTFIGETHGKIADFPRGDEGFAFDFMFIPNEQPNPKNKTFAELGPQKKDKVSMRRRAVEQLLRSELKLGEFVRQLPEPFEDELQRVRKDKLNENNKALKFAYSLEAITENRPNKSFEAQKYTQIYKEDTLYYTRYKMTKESSSIGLVITDIDKANIKLHKNGEPILWQMGSERRTLALAQRAEYFIQNTSKSTLNKIQSLENEVFIKRPNKRSPSLETIMKYDFMGIPFNTKAIKELGYKKLASNKQVSRREISSNGLFNKIGKYPRLMYGVGSMPAVSGWRDVIVTTVIGHMPIFIARNNIFAGNIDSRINLIKDAQQTLRSLGLSKKELHIFERNIGVALGTANPEEQVREAKRFYKEAGIKLFRIYTINSDPRFVETATLLRKEFGDEIEIFAGQVVNKTQVYKLLESANIDGVIIGHGGGRQCTSATNGMALTTVEEVYSLTTDHNFNDITILVEGGVGKSVGALAVLGVDGILYNQQFTRGTIETGGLFIQKNTGEYGQPYHGSASAPTMIIESANPAIMDKMLTYSGRTKVPEGKKGFTIYSEKANSMAFWVEEFKHQMARTFADLGVENINELREFIGSYDKELLRIVSPEAAETAKAYKNRA